VLIKISSSVITVKKTSFCGWVTYTVYVHLVFLWFLSQFMINVSQEKDETVFPIRFQCKFWHLLATIFNFLSAKKVTALVKYHDRSIHGIYQVSIQSFHRFLKINQSECSKSPDDHAFLKSVQLFSRRRSKCEKLTTDAKSWQKLNLTDELLKGIHRWQAYGTCFLRLGWYGNQLACLSMS